MGTQRDHFGGRSLEAEDYLRSVREDRETSGVGRLAEPALLTVTVTVSVRDRGPVFGDERFVAELEDFSLVRESGTSAWEAIRALIGSHGALLERRSSEGDPGW